MESWAIALLIVDVAIAHYGFEFQRTTLGISRALGLGRTVEIAGLQANLTPTWVGMLCAIGHVTWVASAILCFIAWSWVGLGVYLFGRFIGLSVVGGSLPPSRPHYLTLIEKHVRREHGDDTWEQIMSSLEGRGITTTALEGVR